MTIRRGQPGHSPAGLRDAIVGRPVWLQAILDGVGVCLAGATFLQLGEPDMLLHAVWVVLALDAFAFGLRVTILRIAVATVVVVVYSSSTEGAPHLLPLELSRLELTEWPLMVVIAIIVAVMADRLASTSRRYARLYRDASARLMTAQEDERKRLARDLHDGVGQVLAALTLTLDAAENELWTGPGEPSVLARSTITRAQQLAATALEETRDVAFRLRPARIAEAGLAASVRELAASAGRTIAVSIEPALVRPRLLDPDREIEVFRIVQEAITNAIRHSTARTVAVSMGLAGRDLHVVIRDDGVGFVPDAAMESGLGLAGMRERAIVLGATLGVTSSPGRGTTIRLTVPLTARGEPSSAARVEPAEQPLMT